MSEQLHQKKEHQHNQVNRTTLHMEEKKVPNNHSFQFYVDYGVTPGPWLKLGINDVEYGIGYLPSSSHQKTNAGIHVVSTEPSMN
jgi:hypothetical protein